MWDSIPADRVEVPHPASYFQPRPAMPKVRSWDIYVDPEIETEFWQPGSAQAFKPYNTLDGPSRHAPPKKPVAYGKSSRIGHNRGEGQKKYLEMQQSKSQGTPARNVLAHHDQTYGFQGVSPTKRRKTVHPPSQPAQYIDITADEEPSQEVQEIQPPLNSTTPVVRRTTVPRSSHSVRSQRSLENGPAKFGKPSQVEVESASRAVDAVVRASKLKSKSHEHDVHHRTPYGRAKSGSITPNTQLTPIDVEEEYVPTAKAGSIFDGFKQGEIEPATKGREDPSTKTFTSHHFPDARINEHTEDNEGQTANTRPVNGTKTNARNHRRVQPRMDEVDPIIDDDLDELSIDIAPKKDTAIKRQASPPKTSHTANKSAKRKSRAEKSAPAWPLVFARGHGWESRALVTRDGNLPSLTLERDADEPSMWCIMEAERPDLPCEIKAVILKKDVITVHADDEGRIRLQGPRDQSGNYSIYDLDFQHARDLREFRDTYAVKMSSRQKVIPRDVKTMRTIFQKPLLRNTKVNPT
jgi:sentrin-specific protease 7